MAYSVRKSMFYIICPKRYIKLKTMDNIRTVLGISKLQFLDSMLDQIWKWLMGWFSKCPVVTYTKKNKYYQKYFFSGDSARFKDITACERQCMTYVYTNNTFIFNFFLTQLKSDFDYTSKLSKSMRRTCSSGASLQKWFYLVRYCN